jgi:hypothetical protein
MQGESNGIISQNTKVLDLGGAEHSISEIYSVSRRESLPSVVAGERVTLSVFGGNWSGSQFGNSLPTYSPELQQLMQKIKTEKIVALKLR